MLNMRFTAAAASELLLLYCIILCYDLRFDCSSADNRD